MARSFGERVRTSRKRLRSADGKVVTQGRLATLVGVDRNTVSRWENGGMLPKDPSTIASLSRVLKVSADWLVGEFGSDSENDETDLMLEQPVYRLDGGRASTLPSPAADLVTQYLDRLAEVGCEPYLVREAERVLVSGAKHRVSPTPFEERDILEIAADIDAAWDFVVAVFRRQGVRL